MGACLSCLGLSERANDAEPSESERLLYDEAGPARAGYGAADAGPHVSAPDPEEIRRHREMLERICAETANNLIDVQHTSLLTLRGKPSAEFTAILNTHFTTPERYQSSRQPSAPTTPNPNHFADEPLEPASPFTQAQIQAAQQNKNGAFSPRFTEPEPAQFPSNSHSAAPQTPAKGTLRPTAGQSQDHSQQNGDEETDEEAWLESIAGNGGDASWDEIKTSQAGLVIDLNDVPTAPNDTHDAGKTR